MLTKIQWITNDKILCPLLKFYETNNKSTKGIWYIYELFSESLTISSQEQISKWTTFMSTTPPKEQWYKTLSLPLGLSHCTAHWESSHKLFQRWHYTPSRLAKIIYQYHSTLLEKLRPTRNSVSHMVGTPIHQRFLGSNTRSSSLNHSHVN